MKQKLGMFILLMVFTSLGCATTAVVKKSPLQTPPRKLNRLPTAVATPPVPQPLALAPPLVLDPWLRLADGMSFKRIDIDDRDLSGISVYKFDSAKFTLTFHLMRQKDNRPMSSDQVLAADGLEMVIPASMFDDQGKSVPYLRNYEYIENDKPTRNYRSILLFNPKSNLVPKVQILDRQSEGTAAIMENYESAVAMFRMIHQGKRVGNWPGQYYNFLSIGLDRDGNILVFYRSAVRSVYEVIDAIIASDLGVVELGYLDGDSKGTLAVKANGQVDVIGFPGALPNFLGIRRN